MSLRLGDILIAGNSEGGGGNTSIDNLSITKNAINQLQTVGVINQSNATSAIKVWTGTKAEYDLLTPDNNTIYNITDEDTSVDNRVRYNIGDIFYSMRTEDILNGAVVCDGSTYNISDYASGDQSVRNLLRDGKLPYVSLDVYSATITSKGSCRCFGYDANGETFRVPTLSDVFIETGTPESANEKIDAGLPNITGTFNFDSDGNNALSKSINLSGAFTKLYTGPIRTSGNITQANQPGGVDFNASRSSSIYGNSDTVQPNAVKYRAYIQLATDTTDSALQTVSSVLNDVSTLEDQMEETVNYGNITNCITEIPQDIKLELNNGSIIVKAGSKLYIPNGFDSSNNLVFDEIIIQNDTTITVSNQYDYNVVTVSLKSDGTAFDKFKSVPGGTSSSTTPIQYNYCYRTDLNKLYDYETNTTTPEAQLTLPLGLFKWVGGVGFTEIYQIFNGFGYIGSTVFALPDVKGLIPDGRNSDGTLNNIEITTNKVNIQTNPDQWNSYKTLTINEYGNIVQGNYWNETIRRPTFIEDNNNYWYNPETNKVFYYRASSSDRNEFRKEFLVANFGTDANAKITFLEQKYVYRALDYSDSPIISGWGMPSTKSIDLTLGSSGATYIAPANGYVAIDKQNTSSNQYLGIWVKHNNVDYYTCFSSINASTEFHRCFLPVMKGDTFVIGYTAAGSLQYFRFIYAEGEVN